MNLTQQRVESNIRLGPNVHAPTDGEEILAVEKVALEDEGVKAEIAKLQLPEGTVVLTDPWIYGEVPRESNAAGDPTDVGLGSDGIDDDRRMYQCFLYMRDPFNPSDVDSNHYAFPLTISPVVDVVDMKVTRIDFIATGASAAARETQAMKIQPPSEYAPEYQDLRTDLKPLQVIQPEGASFNVIQSGETGRVIEWQKWTVRVGFNQREGMVIYNVSIGGGLAIISSPPSLT